MTSVDLRARSIRLISYVVVVVVGGGGPCMHCGSAGKQKDTPASCRLNAPYLTVGNSLPHEHQHRTEPYGLLYVMHGNVRSEVSQKISLFVTLMYNVYCRQNETLCVASRTPARTAVATRTGSRTASCHVIV